MLEHLPIGSKVLLGSSLLGAVAGAVGCLTVLRRRSLVGDMLAHASLPGVCLAFLWSGSLQLVPLSLGALGSGATALAAMTLITRWTRTREDAALGIVLSTFFGLGVVLLSGISRSAASGASAGLNAYLFGEPGNMLARDLALLAVVAVGVLGTVVACFKEFQLVAFDIDFARSQGWPTLAIDALMTATVGVVAIVGLPIVGAILMSALLILPASTARLWTDRLPRMLLLAGLCGAAAGGLGAGLGRQLPAGPAIVLAAAALFCISAVAAPGNGLIARAAAELRLRARVGHDHLLRSLYELSERALGEHETPRPRPATHADLRRHRAWNEAALRRLVRRAERQGLATRAADGVLLTDEGWRLAATAVKAHRLWELYMISCGGAASDHVDRSADDIEHALPPELIADLERELTRQGRLPASSAALPVSPHALPGKEG
jgi:manganese/zinc/iron transport system permease protein